MPRLKCWKKTKETNDLIEYSNKVIPIYRTHVRWNPVTSRWQSYVTDGDIEIADFGRFKDKDKDDAIHQIQKYMKDNDAC